MTNQLRFFYEHPIPDSVWNLIHFRWSIMNRGSLINPPLCITGRNALIFSKKARILSEEGLLLVNERIPYLFGLQRSLGLSFQEACFLDSRSALIAANKTGFIFINRGTKGGKWWRQVPCSHAGVTALERAISVQTGASLIPKEFTYYDFINGCLPIITEKGLTVHSERYVYAQLRYRELTGSPSPIEAGWEHKKRIQKLAEYLSISESDAKYIDRK